MRKGLAREMQTLTLRVTLGVALGLVAAPGVGRQGGGEPAASSELEVLVAAEELIEAGLYGRAAERLSGLAGEGSPARAAVLGRALALDRRYLAAEGPLRRAFEAGRRDLQTLFFFASTLWENGKLDEAERVYRSALERSSEHPAILQQLGRLALWRGHWEEAAELLDRALAAAPGNLDLILDRARALEGAGRTAEALTDYRMVVELAPDHAGARYGLGRLLSASGSPDEGRSHLEAYREIRRREQEATRTAGRERAVRDRGLALLHSGEPHAAVEHLRGLVATPDNLDALARALAATGDGEESLRALERAVALAPGRRDLRDRLTEARLALVEPAADG